MVSIMDYKLTNSQNEQQLVVATSDNCCSLPLPSSPPSPSPPQSHHQQPPKSAVSEDSIELKFSNKNSNNIDAQLTKRALKLDIVNTNNPSMELDHQFNVKSPKSPVSVSTSRHGVFLQQSSLTSQTDLVEDRKTLRGTLYQGIFHRHRRTIFALGSFLRMLKSRSSQYNTIRSSSEGEDIDESR